MRRPEEDALHTIYALLAVPGEGRGMVCSVVAEVVPEIPELEKDRKSGVYVGPGNSTFVAGNGGWFPQAGQQTGSFNAAYGHMLRYLDCARDWSFRIDILGCPAKIFGPSLGLPLFLAFSIAAGRELGRMKRKVPAWVRSIEESGRICAASGGLIERYTAPQIVDVGHWTYKTHELIDLNNGHNMSKIKTILAPLGNWSDIDIALNGRDPTRFPELRSRLVEKGVHAGCRISTETRHGFSILAIPYLDALIQYFTPGKRSCWRYAAIAVALVLIAAITPVDSWSTNQWQIKKPQRQIEAASPTSPLPTLAPASPYTACPSLGERPALERAPLNRMSSLGLTVQIEEPAACATDLPSGTATKIRGIYRGDTGGKEFWVFSQILSPGDTELRYFPQALSDGCGVPRDKILPTHMKDGTWQTWGFFGIPGYPEVYAVVVVGTEFGSPAAQKFRDYFEHGCLTGEFEGITPEDMPRGVAELASIVVASSGKTGPSQVRIHEPDDVEPVPHEITVRVTVTGDLASTSPPVLLVNYPNKRRWVAIPDETAGDRTWIFRKVPLGEPGDCGKEVTLEAGFTDADIRPGIRDGRPPLSSSDVHTVTREACVP